MKRISLKRKFLVLAAFLCMVVGISAEEVVWTASNNTYRVVKVSASEYRVESIGDAIASVQNSNDLPEVLRTLEKFEGKLTISGKFSNISAFNNNSTKFTSVDLSNLNIVNWDGSENGSAWNFKIADYFNNANTLVLSNYQKSISADPFFNDGLANLHSITFGNGITEIPASCLVNKSSVTSVTIPEGVTSIGSSAFKGTGISSVTLPSTLTSIGAEAFQSTPLTSITIPAAVETLGQGAFNNCTALTTVSFQEKSHVETIEANTFNETNVENITFPTSLKLIKAGAFNECYNLKTMTFPEGITGLTIIGGNAQGGAFSNCTNITDIYIETTDPINCQVDAYPWKITYGQGDPSNQFATIHFPSDMASYYTNLEHALKIEIASDPGRFHDWLMEHVEKANVEPKNGWWQFINAGTNDNSGDPLPGGKFLRTFSDTKYARIVPNGVKAYAITGIEPHDYEVNGEKKKYFTVSMMILDVIPRNTGVILFGEPNATAKGGGGKTLTMTVVSLSDNDGNLDGTTLADGTVVDLSLRRKNWENLAEEHVMFKNYLEPSTVGDEEYTQLQPYKKEGDHGFRYFGFSHYRKSKTGKADESTHGKATKADYDYAGFFRCTNSKIGPGKAYLKLKDDEYTDPEGGEVIIPIDCKTIKYTTKDEQNNTKVVSFYYRDEYDAQNGGWKAWSEDSPYWHVAIWEDKDMFGERDAVTAQPSAQSKFAGEVEIIEDIEEGVATMIIPAPVVDEDGDYYTLQGIKISNPTIGGVYIKNGKKVVIK